MKSRAFPRRWALPSGTAALLVVALAVCTQLAAPAASASARPPHAQVRKPAAVTDPYSPAYHHRYRLGVLPTTARLARMRRWARNRPAAQAAPDDRVNYDGGGDGIGVTTGHEKVYLVFYGSQWGSQGANSAGDVTLSGDPTGEAPYLQEFFKGLGTDHELWSGVMTQYCQGVAIGAESCPAGNTEHVAYPSGGALAGVWADESAASPSEATAAQLGQEAVRAAGHFGNTTAGSNRDAQYFILSPTGTNPDDWLNGGFCAWHNFNKNVGVTSPYGDVAFANFPYVTDLGALCGQDQVNSRGTNDGVSIVGGHEYAETITDQDLPGGWLDVNDSEVGDKCAWIEPGVSGGMFDLVTATGTFAMQTIWANDGAGGAGTCEASHPIVGAATSGPFLYNSSTGASYVDLADGSGGWSGIKGPAFSTGWTAYPGQLNGDGLTDLFLYNPTSGASYVEFADGSGGWAGVKGAVFSAGWSVYPGDYNGDGLTDLFLYNPASGASYVEFADGSGGWTGVKGAVFSAGWSVFPGDLTGNGLTDLFLYNPASGASYAELADGSGGWAGVKGAVFSPGWSVYPGDYNGDGLTDLFLYNSSNGASYVELANGSGGWTAVKGPAFSSGWSVYPAQLNGGGLTDLFLYNPASGASYVELADGAGGWAGVKGAAFSAGWSVYPGHYNGDGLTDLFLYNPASGASYVEFANGSGGWTGVKGPAFSLGWNVYAGQFSDS